MKTNGRKMRTVAVFLLFGLTISCGGGSVGSGSGVNSASGTGSGLNSASSGAIQGFGSIIVNGIEFETQGAEVEIENEGLFSCSPSASDDCGLRIGMMVTLENAFDDKGAPAALQRIKYEDTVQGPIGAYAETTAGRVKTLTILGQTVVLQNGVTRFDDSDPGFDDFSDVGPANLDNLVEVSGFFDFDGSIRATYVERKSLAPSAGVLFEIKGRVESLNTSLSTFAINGLTVDYSGAAIRNGRPANGVFVEAKGGSLVGNTLQATDVEIRHAGFGIDKMNKAQVEGYVTGLNLADMTFIVNGQQVNYATAAFIGGTEAELLEGIKVEAEGPVDGGILLAMKVEFKENIRFEANAASINAAAGTLTLAGLSGISVQADGLTLLNAISGIDDLATGNNLKIRGIRAAAGGTTIIASEIELIAAAPDNRIVLQGPVDGFTPFSSVTLIGVTVDTTTINDNDFKDHDAVIGESEFYTRLVKGRLVKARFDLTAGRWNQIEFQD